VDRIDPPERGFYAKKVVWRSLVIKAGDVVADEALFIARDRMKKMLERSPAVVENLVREGAELHLIGKRQNTSDLPELRHLKHKDFDHGLDVDHRARGLGGLHASCGEENLLDLPGARYEGRDICVHEFAHTVLDYGLSADVQARVDLAFAHATARGLWPGAYARTNRGEYFAELSMWFFGTHGDVGAIDPWPERGPAWLRRYDPEGFAILAAVYEGTIAVGSTALLPIAPRSPAGEGSLTSPISRDPARLRLKNDTDQALDVEWLDFEGKRKHYGEIPPRESVTQETFVGHVWLLAEKNGHGCAIVVAAPTPGLATIGRCPVEGAE
jgi:hypothetical protein